MSETEAPERDLILISHANPEDNLFARWLAARLTTAGFKVWIDLSNLRGGEDFWTEIEENLRSHTKKQIVIVSHSISKQGLKKELSIGDYVGRKLGDNDFIIPIRIHAVPHGEFPPELHRRHAFDAFPNWADVLGPLIESLDEYGVPRISSPKSVLLDQLVLAQESGRATLLASEETLVSNWFPIKSLPSRLILYGSKGTRDQLDKWLPGQRLPYIKSSGLIGTLVPKGPFEKHHQPEINLDDRFWIPTDEIPTGDRKDPFPNRQDMRNALVNLIRQHWDYTLKRRGLKPFEYADNRVGWFFPDGLLTEKAKFVVDGRTVNRVLSGKFKDRRWHLCLIAQPRLHPFPLIRVHANMVLSEDGFTPLPGKATHALRRRLTKTWWNDKWRDLLLASMAWLAEGSDELSLSAGGETFSLSSIPIGGTIGATYEAEEARGAEETSSGEIELNEEIDDEVESQWEKEEDIEGVD